MKIFFLFTVISVAFGSSALADAPKSTTNFSDNTKVEVVGVPGLNGASTSTNLVQIKQGDGTVCYAVVQVGNNSSFPNSISCLRP